MVSITVENLTCSFGRKEVLHGITHAFEPGTFTAVMGKNGSGKTTLLRCINKSAAIAKGAIRIGGEDIRGLTPEAMARITAFVPQGQETVFGATVFETVLLGRLPFMTWSPAETDYQIVEEVLDTLRLQHFSTTDIHHISGGERQKVYVARAIAQKTPLILLDEPITYLDIKHQLEIMAFLQQLAQQGYTIVMVIHDLNLALQYCSHFVFLKDGSLHASCRQDGIHDGIVRSVFEVETVKISDHRQRTVFYFWSKS